MTHAPARGQPLASCDAAAGPAFPPQSIFGAYSGQGVGLRLKGGAFALTATAPSSFGRGVVQVGPPPSRARPAIQRRNGSPVRVSTHCPPIPPMRDRCFHGCAPPRGVTRGQLAGHRHSAAPCTTTASRAAAQKPGPAICEAGPPDCGAGKSAASRARLRGPWGR